MNHHLSTGGNTANFGYISLCYRVLDLLSCYFLVQTADKEIGGDNDRLDERIQQINNYIRANYNQPISLKELSEKLYLSNGYLSRFFKKNYGMNFAEYLTNIRLFHAVDELLYTSTPITVIAYDNGFASVAVFNKAFKKAYGETPSALRKKSKEQKEEDTIDQEDYTEIQKRLEKYLIENRVEQIEEQKVKELQNSHSVKRYDKLQYCWGNTLNMGMASDILKSGIQEHIILLKESLGFEYVRFCNPFTREMLIGLDSVNGKYNFTKLGNAIGGSVGILALSAVGYAANSETMSKTTLTHMNRVINFAPAAFFIVSGIFSILFRGHADNPLKCFPKIAWTFKTTGFCNV